MPERPDQLCAESEHGYPVISEALGLVVAMGCWFACMLGGYAIGGAYGHEMQGLFLGAAVGWTQALLVVCLVWLSRVAAEAGRSRHDA